MNQIVENLFDNYSRRARLYPAIISIAPLFLVYFTPFLNSGFELEHGVVLAVVAAFTFALADLSRRFGKSVEKNLLSVWGGYPSKIFLRHRNKEIDRVTKERYHRKAANLIGLDALPTPNQEQLNPFDADEIYESVVRKLLSVTRDSRRYSLLFKENVNYGFRRNLLGLKLISIFIILVSIVIIIIRDIDIHNFSLLNSQLALFSILGLALLMIVWMCIITRNYVREAADDYAKQLLSCLENL